MRAEAVSLAKGFQTRRVNTAGLEEATALTGSGGLATVDAAALFADANARCCRTSLLLLQDKTATRVLKRKMLAFNDIAFDFFGTLQRLLTSST